jgi:DNA-binding NarL/FixJ family response regulator
MDVQLPDLSGLAAASANRAVDPPSRVIIVSSYDQPFLRQTARELGAIAYVLKDELSELRSLLIGGARAPSQSNSEGGKAPESAHTTQPVDPDSPGNASTRATDPSVAAGEKSVLAGTDPPFVDGHQITTIQDRRSHRW